MRFFTTVGPAPHKGAQLPVLMILKFLYLTREPVKRVWHETMVQCNDDL